MLAVFKANADTADLLFVVAWLALWLIGVIMIMGKSVLPGLACCALGFVPFAALFLTP
jgi:hypothetical protein